MLNGWDLRYTDDKITNFYNNSWKRDLNLENWNNDANESNSVSNWGSCFEPQVCCQTWYLKCFHWSLQMFNEITTRWVAVKINSNYPTFQMVDWLMMPIDVLRPFCAHGRLNGPFQMVERLYCSNSLACLQKTEWDSGVTV